MAERTVRQWLDEHVNLERGDLPGSLGSHAPRVPTPSLDRIRALVELLGQPQLSYPIVHVTGTNGKSSTARMTAALLAGRGLSVGLYTSPHLVRVNERLARNDTPIDDESLDGVLETVRLAEGQMDEGPSYFEILTAAAFSWFADIAVDVAVVEVGLGGMWDATNVGDAAVAVVTNVAIDHVEYLGPTRYAIAKEKAGIVKEGSSLVLGEPDPELSSLFTDEPRPVRVYRRGPDFGALSSQLAHNGRLVSLEAPSGVYDDVFLPVHGAHQADNAACALAAAEAFFGGDAFDRAVVDAAFAAIALPGRLEVVGRHPLVVLDGAHNVEGARALRQALDEEFATEWRTLVVGMLREKEPHEMLEALGAAQGDRVVACRPPSPRALDPELVAAAAQNLGLPSAAVETVEMVPEAVARALAATPESGQVVVTGSLYTVGAARSALVSA